MKTIFLKPLMAFAFLLFIGAGTVNAQNYSLFGDASITEGHGSPRGAEVTTTGTTGYGGIDLTTALRGNRTLSSLNYLSTDYKITQGPIGQGSPRFVVETAEGNLFIYLGTAPGYMDPAGDWENTGNLASSGNLVDASQLGGGFYESFGDVQAAYGDLKITAIYLVMDGSNQTVVFDNTMVNNTFLTYENKLGKYN
jgi:hypothetical protein